MHLAAEIDRIDKTNCIYLDIARRSIETPAADPVVAASEEDGVHKGTSENRFSPV